MVLPFMRFASNHAAIYGARPNLPPDAFGTSDWSVAAGDEEADVTINSLPAANGATITDIEYRLDGGSWVSSGGIISFTITGLTNDQEYDVEMRAVNSAGAGDASDDVKQVTPTGGASYDTASEAIFAAFTTPPTTTRKGQIDTLVLALKADGIWSKLDGLYVFAAADSQAALINWKNPGTYNGTTVNSPTFTADEGFTGTATGYITTGFNASTAGGNWSQNSGHYGAWNLNNPAGNKYWSGQGNHSNRTVRHNTNIVASLGRTAVDCSIGSTPSIQGCWLTTRTGSTAQALYKDGSSANSNSDTSMSLHNSTLTFLASEGTNRADGVQECCAYWGAGISSGEAADFYAALSTYMTAVGAI